MFASITDLSMLVAIDYSLKLYPELDEVFSQDFKTLLPSLLTKAQHSKYEGQNNLLVEKFSLFTPEKQRAFQYEHVAPKYDLHTVARELFMDQQIEEAIKEGYEQVVVYTSGLSPLVYCLAKKYPEILFFESSRDEKSQKIKGKIFQPLDSGNYHLIENNLPVEGSESHFNPNKKTLYVLKAFTMYYSEAEVRLCLNKLRNSMLTSEGSQLLLSFNFPNAVRSDIEKNALQQSKESMKFGLFPENIIPFCNDMGLHVTGQLQTFELHKILSVLTEKSSQISSESEIASEKETSLLGKKGENHIRLVPGEGPQALLDLDAIPIISYDIVPQREVLGYGAC